MADLTVRLDSLHAYAKSRCGFLREIGVGDSCRDPLAEFSEWLVARQLNGRIADSRVQKGFDVIGEDGRKIQVKYLANPSSKWRNEHHIQFPDGVDDYALVVFENVDLRAVIVFARDHMSQVCSLLGKRHPKQDRELQLTRANYQKILAHQDDFGRLGVRCYVPR